MNDSTKDELIKSLTKIIEKLMNNNEKLISKIYSLERQLSILHFELGKLETKNNE